MGTRLCSICFKPLWIFAGCWCAFNRNSQIFSVIFTFSSLQLALKRNFKMCSVQSFVLIIVNQFMVIKFTLIGYYRMRYVLTKLFKNSFLNQALCGRRVPGFLKSIMCGSSVCVFVCVCVCVCVSAPEAINN